MLMVVLMLNIMSPSPSWVLSNFLGVVVVLEGAFVTCKYFNVACVGTSEAAGAVAPVFPKRSEPAKSTKFNLPALIR